MARYRPFTPFTVPMRLLVPTTVEAYGVITKTFTDPDESALIYGSFRTFGGTENTENGVYTLVNTATVDTWYRPDIQANCRIYLIETGDTYDIISDPEDIEFRHQYLQFRVQKVGGKP